jgi:hypothetical protein
MVAYLALETDAATRMVYDHVLVGRLSMTQRSGQKRKSEEMEECALVKEPQYWPNFTRSQERSREGIAAPFDRSTYLG